MKYRIITIEREYGSGGNEIGERVAGKLGIPCYGREILERVAADRGTTAAQIIHMEESATTSLLHTVAMVTSMAAGVSDGLSETNQLYIDEARVIKKLADQGPCVLIGRCAGWVLRERQDVLRVFIHADQEIRQKRAVEVYGEDEKRITTVLRRSDKRRNNYYSANTGRNWDDKKSYHIVLDSGSLGLNTCIDAICTCTK